MNLSRRLASEVVGTALLLTAVVGSGIIGERLACCSAPTPEHGRSRDTEGARQSPAPGIQRPVAYAGLLEPTRWCLCAVNDYVGRHGRCTPVRSTNPES